MFTRITVILFLCLFSFACSTTTGTGPLPPPPSCNNKIWPCPKPSWAIDGVIPYGEEGAIACSNAFLYRQKKAISKAITELARHNGINVEGEFKMDVTKSSSVATFKTTQGTQVTVKAKTYKVWNSPAGVEKCVWLKQIK